MGQVVSLELTLDLERVAKCREEMDHTIVALIVGTRSNIPLALRGGGLLKVDEDGHVNGGKELPIGNIFVFPAITSADDVILLANGHFILPKSVARLGVVEVLDHKTIIGEDDAQTHGTISQKSSKPDMEEGEQTGPKAGIARWDDLTGIEAGGVYQLIVMGKIRKGRFIVRNDSAIHGTEDDITIPSEFEKLSSKPRGFVDRADALHVYICRSYANKS